MNEAHVTLIIPWRRTNDELKLDSDVWPYVHIHSIKLARSNVRSSNIYPVFSWSEFCFHWKASGLFPSPLGRIAWLSLDKVFQSFCQRKFCRDSIERSSKGSRRLQKISINGQRMKKSMNFVRQKRAKAKVLLFSLSFLWLPIEIWRGRACVARNRDSEILELALAKLTGGKSLFLER